MTKIPQFSLLSAALLLTACTVQADEAGAQKFPEINEQDIEKVFYVDPDKGEQGNPGSKKDPFPSISKATSAVVSSLQNGQPTKLVLAPGVYREDIRYIFHFKKNSDSNLIDTLLVVEGEKKGEVVISGSETEGWQGKTWEKHSENVYSHEWPYDTEPEPGPWINTYGFAMLPQLSQRTEMLWLNNRSLRQVMAEKYRWEDPDGTRKLKDVGRGIAANPDVENVEGKLIYDGLALPDPADLPEPYSFAVYTDPSTSDDLRGKIFIRLPEGKSPRDYTIEVGDWIKDWAPLLAIRHKNNFVLRNLTFTHGTAAGTCAAVTINNCENFLIEHCDFSNNGAMGLSINRSTQGAVKHSTARYNMTNGFATGNGARHILIEDCDTSFNNIRGGWSGWNAWHASAFKSGGVHNITVRRHTSIGNYANGLWYDVYCTNILTEDSFFMGNKRMGVMYELTKPNGGPHVIRRSVMTQNDACGLYITMAANTVAEDCIIVRNKAGLIENEDAHSEIFWKFRDHPQGPNSAEEWESVILTGNIIASEDGMLFDYLNRRSDPETQYQRILKVLTINNNQYWLADEDAAFMLPDGKTTDLSGWRRLLKKMDAPEGLDKDSTWQKPDWDEDEKREFTSESQSGLTKKAREMGIPLPDDLIKEYWDRMEKGMYDAPHFNRERQYD